MDLNLYVEEMRRLGLYKEGRNDYIVMCPSCYEEKKSKGVNNYSNLKLYIDKGLRYSRCFRCDSVFLSDDDSLHKEVRALEMPVDMSNWTVTTLGSEGYWTLDRFNEFDEDDEIGVDYLGSRYYPYRKAYKKLGIRFKDHNPVVPFYYKGELIYYQIRLIDKNSKIKYFSPPAPHKNPYVIESKTGDNSSIVICEGTFDAIACKYLYPDRTPFAVLGSDITQYQIAMLRSYCPENIYIYMDKTDISLRVKSSIEKYINYANIEIIESDGTDPEERLKLNLLRSND